jgi:hypothetical protein
MRAFHVRRRRYPNFRRCAVGAAVSNVGPVSYKANTGFNFDLKTSAFVFNAALGTAVTVGKQLIISYTKKGHRMDGILIDTVDDSDVYPVIIPLMMSSVCSQQIRVPNGS